MKQKVWGLSLGLMLCTGALYADEGTTSQRQEPDGRAKLASIEAVQQTDAEAAPRKRRFTIGGYGEAVYSYNFYSDNYLRYDSPQNYKDDTHGRFDLPHVVIMLGYDFGKGWTMGTEIEFEHGGTESAVEIEEHEGGEYESEVERGGEVALEQFWIQKSFCPQFNIKLGHMVVPVGMTNAHHLPTEFFGVYRPEGENTILPCTWHETGISLWGRAGQWRYEAMLLAGLDSDRFGSKEWVKGGAGSPYEFKIANAMAGAFRVDNYSVKGLRLSLSGYAGNSFSNTLKKATNAVYDDVKGTVLIGAFDFCRSTMVTCPTPTSSPATTRVSPRTLLRPSSLWRRMPLPQVWRWATISSLSIPGVPTRSSVSTSSAATSTTTPCTRLPRP